MEWDLAEFHFPMFLQIGNKGIFLKNFFVELRLSIFLRLIATPATQPLTLYIGKIPLELDDEFLLQLLEVKMLWLLNFRL